MNIGVESESVEFKENIGQLDKGVRSLSAMLNRCQFGTVYFGVDDDGNVIGMDIGESTLEKIRNAVRTDIAPQVVPTIAVHQSDDGKKYVSLTATGSNIPYCCKEKYYIRNVSSDEGAGPEIVVELALSRGIDPLKDMESDLQELSFNYIFTSLSAFGFHTRNDSGFYRSIGFIVAAGSFNFCAYLMSDQNDLPIQVVEFAGTDRSRISKRTDFGPGCLVKSMEAVSDYISSFQETLVDTDRLERAELPLFDYGAFREAWVNACVHNAWRMLIPPSVLVFDDRIEVVSYGRIPFPSSIEQFFTGNSRPVNVRLFSIFAKLRKIEQSGHGVPRIVRTCGREAFRITDSGVTVTIPFNFRPRFVYSRKANEDSVRNLGSDSRKVFDYVLDHPVARLADVSKSTGISLSNVKKTMVKLKDDGLLRNDGTNRNAKWVTIFDM